MKNKLDYDFTSLEGVFQRPEPLNVFALERMDAVKDLFRDRESYNCPPSCRQCCYGSILMSYTEFNYIMLYLEESWSWEKIIDLFQTKVGLLADNDGTDTLLCPFLQEDAEKEHCSIYRARPLICRVFGTAAAPCGEPITPSAMEESLFYRAYDLLYYGSGRENFIALNLHKNWAIYEAPFALWCLADNSEETRMYLYNLIASQKNSFNAVLYDREECNFFVYRNGYKTILRP
ncbi:MAG: YkgJ family cysteine cluster protein [Dethiobacteria bacterium]|jgi:hypothetical protein